ncbi:hypothetical protein [Mycolicibacterium stellerae]|nr:hypothetical protein [Mycolicibacterium stellerae]
MWLAGLTAVAYQHVTSRCGDPGGLGGYYSERETRTPVWLLAGDTHTISRLIGLTDAQRAGGEVDAEVVARWLDEGIVPSGAHGRAFPPFRARSFAGTFGGLGGVDVVVDRPPL